MLCRWILKKKTDDVHDARCDILQTVNAAMCVGFGCDTRDQSSLFQAQPGA